jgi:hypothetical protein
MTLDQRGQVNVEEWSLVIYFKSLIKSLTRCYEGGSSEEDSGDGRLPFITSNSKFVEMRPDDLLQLNSQEMETYLKMIRSSRTLSVAEDKELKRIRRLIKNREYAQSSRNKRKQHAEGLQQQVDEISKVTYSYLINSHHVLGERNVNGKIGRS